MSTGQNAGPGTRGNTENGYSVSEAARVTGWERSELQRLIKSGDITVTRAGGRVRIGQRQLDILKGDDTR
ncbi:excisionase family DNA-binding protein [Kineosporia babensis]|uniref:Excisionase family DNA-binding protein n=1 Tax=Kineosporia babensis TaxID=499548 RepID=A0A9X1SYQ9_9ACTN|nr:excisionase family DNA-binding protein [Kineosporia babensis]MCD5317169.1 excisionase family DNA-binding protein [Kineosporia babensis]